MKWSLWIIIPSLTVPCPIPKPELLLILHDGQASQGAPKTSDLSFFELPGCATHVAVRHLLPCSEMTQTQRTCYEPSSFSLSSPPHSPVLRGIIPISETDPGVEQLAAGSPGQLSDGSPSCPATPQLSDFGQLT